LQNLFQKDKSMRKLIQASLLTLALTASIHAGDIGQPVTAVDIGQPIAAQGDIPNGITQTILTALEAVLFLI
jgi:hypothetical protein